MVSAFYAETIIIMRILLINILLFLSFHLISQNIVVDGSFEDYYKCPESLGSFNLLSWMPIKSPDYYNICDSSNTKTMGIPKNIGGFQYPYNGDGYAGFYLFKLNQGDIEAGEFIQTMLAKKLSINRCYMVSFYLSMQDFVSNAAIKEVGCFFSMNSINNEVFLDTIKPQVVNINNTIYDTTNWIQVKGAFLAQGNEEFLTIGNFFIQRQLTYITIPLNATAAKAFYYIDAVSVYPCDAPIATAQCISDTTLCFGSSLSPGQTKVEPQYKAEYQWLWYKANHPEDTLSTQEFPVFQPDTTTTYVLKLRDFKYDVTYDTVSVTVVDCKTPTNLKVFPNPTNDKVFFEFDSTISEQMSIDVFNLMGQKIKGLDYRSNKQTNRVELNLQTQSNGIYFYRVLIENEVKFNGKIVKYD
jgi:hypothetical protein